MAGTNQWEDFYDRHAPFYDRGSFTRHTAVEVDFLEDVLGLAKGTTILDVGCGTGRHSVELARRGYGVTGIDLSAGMLDEARRKAVEARVDVEFVHADATEFVAPNPFDAVVCLCGSAFTMVDLGGDADAHDRRVKVTFKPGRALEVGAGEAPAVAALLSEHGFASVDVRRDYGKIERVVSGARPR